MMDFLTILIDLILIWAVSRRLPPREVTIEVPHKLYPKLKGKLDCLEIKAAVAEKFAERAFTMASTANLGVMALQKSLQLPRPLTKSGLQRNQLAKNEVDKLFNTNREDDVLTTHGGFDYLRPILSQEENDILDALEMEKLKNGVL
jgi:hypothetical protein